LIITPGKQPQAGMAWRVPPRSAHVPATSQGHSPGNGTKASPEPALFLPGLAALKQTDRLLLPRHLYESDMDAEVLHAPRHYTLSFGRLLEHTPGFDLIDFSLIADEPL
jgi:hypothetical protein